MIEIAGGILIVVFVLAFWRLVVGVVVVGMLAAALMFGGLVGYTYYQDQQTENKVVKLEWWEEPGAVMSPDEIIIEKCQKVYGETNYSAVGDCLQDEGMNPFDEDRGNAEFTLEELLAEKQRHIDNGTWKGL